MANSVHQGLFVNICKSVVYETGILKWGDCPWNFRFQAQNTRFGRLSVCQPKQSEGWAGPGCASLPCSLRSHRARSLSPARQAIHGRAVYIRTDQLLSVNEYDYRRSQNLDISAVGQATNSNGAITINSNSTDSNSHLARYVKNTNEGGGLSSNIMSYSQFTT